MEARDATGKWLKGTSPNPGKLDRLRAAINAVMESPTASLTTPATSVISTLQGLVSDFCNGEEEEAQLGDRTYKLASGTTSEYGRYVKYPGGAP
jgi:hypothetical protein